MTREHDARPLGADPVAWDDFDRLQGRLPALFRDVFAHRTAERTVVVVPGLSLDPEVLVKVRGVRFYEERMLSMLMLLRLPNTRVVFVTSSPIDPSIVDYYLGMLPGIPSRHARQRLTLLCTHDASLRSLTDKILAATPPRIDSRPDDDPPLGVQRDRVGSQVGLCAGHSDVCLRPAQAALGQQERQS